MGSGRDAFVGALGARLERHASRRRDRIATVTVMVGDLDASRAMLLADARRILVFVSDMEDPIERFLHEVLSRSEFVNAALERLSVAFGRRPEDLRADLAAKSPRDLASWRQGVLSRSPEPRVVEVCAAALGAAPPIGLGVEHLEALVELLGERCPSLVLTHSTAEFAVALAERAPSVPLILLASRDELATWLDDSMAHAPSLLLEGLVWDAHLVDDETRRATRYPAFERSSRPESEGPSDARRALRRALEAAWRPAGTVQDQDRARSLAERLLFEALEARASTRGRFRQNDRVPIPFGGAPWMEIDLFDPASGIAVEVDGYYHFTDCEAYRRDRRKDLAMQLAGHLMVRVLASDVAADAVDAADKVAAALAARQRSPEETT